MRGSFSRRWHRLPENLQLTYGLIFSTVAISGLVFIDKFFSLPLKEVAGATTGDQQTFVSRILNSIGDFYDSVLASPMDLAVYVGLPLFVTILLFLLFQIRKSVHPTSKAIKASKSDDELI